METFFIIQIISTFILGVCTILFLELSERSRDSKWKQPLKFLWWKMSIKWLNMNSSSTNKWDLDANGQVQPYIKKWYHLGVAPTHKEKFAYSSTILVPLTDGEHTFQKQMLNSLLGVLFVWSWVAGLAFTLGIYGFTFTKEKFIKRLN